MSYSKGKLKDYDLPRQLKNSSPQNEDEIQSEIKLENLNFVSLKSNISLKNLSKGKFNLMPNDVNTEKVESPGLKFKKHSSFSLDDSHSAIQTNSQLHYNSSLGEFIINQKFHHNLTEITDLHSLRIICKNLDNEIKERKDEVKILRRNFREKIQLMELENKKLIESIELKFKNTIDNIYQNHENKLKEIDNQKNIMKNQYEEIINKLITEINAWRSGGILMAEHKEEINLNNKKWIENFERMKEFYTKKIKEVASYIDKPEYLLLIERIKFFSTHKESLEKMCDECLNNPMFVEFFNFLKKCNYDTDLIYLCLDKLRLGILDADTVFISEMTEIELNYLNIYHSLKLDKKDDYEKLKNKIYEKFTYLEKFNISHEEEDQSTIGMLASFKNNNSLLKIKSSNYLSNSNMSYSSPIFFKEEGKHLQFNSSFWKNNSEVDEALMNSTHLKKGILYINF